MKHSIKQTAALSIFSFAMLAASPIFAAEPNEKESNTDSSTEPAASRAARAASSVFDELDREVFLGGKFSTWVSAKDIMTSMAMTRTTKLLMIDLYLQYPNRSNLLKEILFK